MKATQEQFFNVVVGLSFLLMLISTLGTSSYFPKYSNLLRKAINLYVAIVLIWRFNPMRKPVVFSSLDRQIAFSAGIFIASTTFLNKYIEYLKTLTVTQLHLRLPSPSFTGG